MNEKLFIDGLETTDSDPRFTELLREYNKKYKSDNSFLQGYYGALEWGGNLDDNDPVANLHSVAKKLNINIEVKRNGKTIMKSW